MIPSPELGKILLNSLSVSVERSVSSRLEVLETGMKVVQQSVEKLSVIQAPPAVINVDTNLLKLPLINYLHQHSQRWQ